MLRRSAVGKWIGGSVGRWGGGAVGAEIRKLIGDYKVWVALPARALKYRRSPLLLSIQHKPTRLPQLAPLRHFLAQSFSKRPRAIKP